MRTAIFVSSLLLSGASLSCGSNGKSNESDEAIEPKFSSIQHEIFDEHCSAPSCHGSGMKGGLSLIAGNSYNQLIGIAGSLDKKNIPPFVRVLPGKPDSSFLFVKITLPDSSQGEIMPKGSDRLSQKKIEAVRQWILDGAPDN